MAAPRDVAVYGLSVGADASAEHVAIVIGDATRDAGPDVVNGDGDRTGFSVVETGTDQLQVDADQHVSTLAGYVSPAWLEETGEVARSRRRRVRPIDPEMTVPSMTKVWPLASHVFPLANVTW